LDRRVAAYPGDQEQGESSLARNVVAMEEPPGAYATVEQCSRLFENGAPKMMKMRTG